jgi:CxxC motif-containing protein (DUF1111 family)
MRRSIDRLRRTLRGAHATPASKNNRPHAAGKRALWLAIVALAGVCGMAAAIDADLPGLASRDDISATDLARVVAITKPTVDFSKPEQFELMQGGAGTSRKRVNQDAFSHSSANITFEEEGAFKLGNGIFRKVWVSAPSSTQASDGLGPTFNARACQSCHLKDGRGHPPEGSPDATSMFLRLARQAETVEEKAAVPDHKVLNFPDKVYGGQLQDLAVPGLPGEGKMAISYVEQPVTLKDRTVIPLRKPTYSVTNLAHGPLGPATTLSARVTPQMIGLGLVEQIHPADVLAHADPDDSDGDGISGKAAIVRDKKTGVLALGRFGWKASAPSIRQQTADAFAGDIGISTPEVPQHWGDCTQTEADCLAMPSGVQERLGSVEAPDPIMDLVTFYSQNLAVPARRDISKPAVLKGKQLFYQSGCVSCHTPKFVTRRDAPNKAQAFQLIWPYSDFLLHDLGERLADGQQVGDATGNEWRTAPLWGIGLVQTVQPGSSFLHDGRARDLAEAILWHGGEAEAARESFRTASALDRNALLAFLASL